MREIEVKEGDAVLIKDQPGLEDHRRFVGIAIREWDGDYDKRFYNVHLASGEIVQCYPNAGIMNSTDNSGRSWTPDQKVLISDITDDEQPYRRNSAQRRQVSPTTLALLGLAVSAARDLDLGNEGPSIDGLPLDRLVPGASVRYATPSATDGVYEASEGAWPCDQARRARHTPVTPTPAQHEVPCLQARARRRALKKRRR